MLRKFIAAMLAAGALAAAFAPSALAGSGNGTSSSHGANHFGNAVSSGAKPQPA